MLGLSEPLAEPPAAPRPGPPRPAGGRHTMLGVAPAGAGRDGFELASLDDDAELEADELEADLPVPSGRRDDFEEVGLPMASSRAPAALEIELPLGDDDVDLPSPAEAGLPIAAGELPDLASPRGVGDSFDDFGELDLPSPADDGLGLPELGEVGLPDLGESDLPTIGGSGLPAVAGTDLPSLGGVDLPTIGGIGLPEIGGSGLPNLSGELPSLGEAELPIVGGSLPSPGAMARNPTGLPSLSAQVPGLVHGDEIEEMDFDALDGGASEDPFALSEAPRPQGSPPRPPRPQGDEAPDDFFGSGPKTSPESAQGASRTGSAFGEVDLGGGGSDDDEFDAFPTETEGASAKSGHTAGSAEGYGDVSLDDGGAMGGGLGLDDHEGAPIPSRGPAAAASAQVELPGEEPQKKASVRAPRLGLSRGVKIAIVSSLAVAVGGGALGALSPDIGPYGAYLAIDLVKADTYERELSGDIQKANALLAKDTASSIEEAFLLLDQGRASAPRYKARVAMAAYLGLLRRIRFGDDSKVSSSAAALLGGLSEAAPSEVKHLELARLASKLAKGDATSVAQAGSISKGAEFAVLVGEASLQVGNLELAAQAFSAVLKATPGARGDFGMARVHLAGGDLEKAKSAAEAALKANGTHVGAQLILAELDLKERKKDEALAEALTQLTEPKSGASQREQVQAWILLGDLHMGRARLKKAEDAFTKALSLEAGNAAAQRGLADALFEGGRFSEAQTRYEAALQADARSLPAAIGLVRSKLRLEELDEAANLLQALEKEYPKSTIVEYWLGQAAEARGDREVAQAAYDKAIEIGDLTTELVHSYIALTRLLGQQGKAEEADVVIAKAEQQFPDDPLVFEALAELSSGRGSFDDAIRDYDRALKLDPGNLGLRFSKGIALRKARRFDEALAQFEYVEKESKDYPGLALERGNLYEASGKTEEALRAYEGALAVAPNDPDLKLRVGCGRAFAHQHEEALKLLLPVYEARPNSAEVNFCMGLANLFAPGKLIDAKRYLQRAVGFDASRSNYHLYVGWAALELSDYPLAMRSFDRAIELDRTQAEAYWKRGELLVRQGAVDTAVRDLTRALELAPTMTEPHAQLALAYVQNGHEPKALEEWKLATASETADPYYHFQYGRLLFDNRRAKEAEEQLESALEKIEKLAPQPSWALDAHRYYAMSLGRQRSAIEHWEIFIERAPKASPYRTEAVRELSAILATQGH